MEIINLTNYSKQLPEIHKHVVCNYAYNLLDVINNRLDSWMYSENISLFLYYIFKLFKTNMLNTKKLNDLMTHIIIKYNFSHKYLLWIFYKYNKLNINVDFLEKIYLTYIESNFILEYFEQYSIKKMLQPYDEINTETTWIQVQGFYKSTENLFNKTLSFNPKNIKYLTIIFEENINILIELIFCQIDQVTRSDLFNKLLNYDAHIVHSIESKLWSRLYGNLTMEMLNVFINNNVQPLYDFSFTLNKYFKTPFNVIQKIIDLHEKIFLSTYPHDLKEIYIMSDDHKNYWISLESSKETLNERTILYLLVVTCDTDKLNDKVVNLAFEKKLLNEKLLNIIIEYSTDCYSYKTISVFLVKFVKIIKLLEFDYQYGIDNIIKHYKTWVNYYTALNIMYDLLDKSSEEYIFLEAWREHNIEKICEIYRETENVDKIIYYIIDKISFFNKQNHIDLVKLITPHFKLYDMEDFDRITVRLNCLETLELFMFITDLKDHPRNTILVTKKSLIENLISTHQCLIDNCNEYSHCVFINTIIKKINDNYIFSCGNYKILKAFIDEFEFDMLFDEKIDDTFLIMFIEKKYKKIHNGTLIKLIKYFTLKGYIMNKEIDEFVKEKNLK